VVGLLLNRWFWMFALAIGLFLASAGWAHSFQSHRETKAAYKALVANYEATQVAYNEREAEVKEITAQLTERRRVIYVAKDDCADTRVADDILVGLRGAANKNP